MIIKTSLSLSDPTRTCQVSAELELDNQATADQLSTKTSELLKGLQSGFADALSGSTLKNVTPSANPSALVAEAPNGNAIPANQKALPAERGVPKRKPRPEDPASEKQLKYLNDLLLLNGLNMAKWCREKNAQKDHISRGQCQRWIPELQNMCNGSKFPF